MPRPAPRRSRGFSPVRRQPETGTMEDMNALMRPRQGRLIAGVCAAVANRFGWNVTLVRILTAIAVIFFGLSLWAYIILWILIPNEG